MISSINGDRNLQHKIIYGGQDIREGTLQNMWMLPLDFLGKEDKDKPVSRTRQKINTADFEVANCQILCRSIEVRFRSSLCFVIAL